MTKCKKHPRYTAKRPPRALCTPCWMKWLDAKFTGIDWDRSYNLGEQEYWLKVYAAQVVGVMEANRKKGVREGYAKAVEARERRVVAPECNCTPDYSSHDESCPRFYPH